MTAFFMLHNWFVNLYLWILLTKTWLKYVDWSGQSGPLSRIWLQADYNRLTIFFTSKLWKPTSYKMLPLKTLHERIHNHSNNCTLILPRLCQFLKSFTLNEIYNLDLLLSLNFELYIFFRPLIIGLRFRLSMPKKNGNPTRKNLSARLYFDFASNQFNYEVVSSTITWWIW